MTQPDAGWYNDPDDTTSLRWWNGVSWSEQTKERVKQAGPTIAEPAAMASGGNFPSVAPYVPGSSYAATAPRDHRPNRKEKDRQTRKNNPMAYTGLFLSVLALLINPLALLSVLGIIFSAIGLAKSHELDGLRVRVTGKGTAIGGLIVGSIGVVLFGWFLTH
ncbi:DUF2510 domain-containing protein [Cryobacterium tepidiphilum]|uniref:DUF2510 domain-containing protein n=1 Tax=Cryobacterium tepidiphilum TaxID=2486026 RepID=UPI001314F101|nr:DUF2510 domain-containing protein [Cryobacterium tepidiphilum]